MSDKEYMIYCDDCQRLYCLEKMQDKGRDVGYNLPVLHHNISKAKWNCELYGEPYTSIFER